MDNLLGLAFSVVSGATRKCAAALKDQTAIRREMLILRDRMAYLVSLRRSLPDGDPQREAISTEIVFIKARADELLAQGNALKSSMGL